MGRKYFDDEDDHRHTHKKKQPKHSKNIRGTGMKTINSYDEDDDYYDPFDDELEMDDQIFITHTKNTI